MRLPSGVRRYFRRRPAPDEADTHVDDEIRLHLELRVEQLMARGMSEPAARAEAERRFGALPRARWEMLHALRRREARMNVREWFGSWRDDMRYSTRSLVGSPLFTVTVVLTLALGIGANAVMFGLIDRLLLRGPAHVTAPDRVFRLYATTIEAGESSTGATMGYVMYTLLRDQASAPERVAAYSSSAVTIGRGLDARELPIAYATWDLFPLLGVQPVRGRFFTQAEDSPPQGQRVVVIDETYWRSELAGATDVIGRTLILSDVPYEIIGVAPRGFTGATLERVAAWVPMTTRRPPTDDWVTTWNAAWLRVVARLPDDGTAEQAGQEATALYRASFTGGEPDASATLSLRPLRSSESGTEANELAVTRWLAGVSLIVLLIACANVANLLLSRALRRQREIGVRLALGVGRSGLVRLLLTDSLLLALAGGLTALAFAHWGSRFVRAVLFPGVHWYDAPLSGGVLLFSALTALVVGVVIGLLPARHAFRPSLTPTLGPGTRATAGGRRANQVRSALTIAQAALSVVLLIGAGLFVRSLRNASTLDLGIEPDHVIVASARFTQNGVAAQTSSGDAADAGGAAPDLDARRSRFYESALARVRAMPGIEAAAVSIGTPFRAHFEVELRVPGHDSLPALPGGGPYISAVTDGFFETVGIRIARGRPFTPADGTGAPVAIVDETMAATLWPSDDALGQCLYIGYVEQADGTYAPSTTCSRIVGIAARANRRSLEEEASMQYYIPADHADAVGIGGMNLLVRPRGELSATVPRLREALHALDPTLSYIEMFPLQDRLDPYLRPWRLGASMFLLFGALALLIAAVGLYSVIAYGVAQRRAELGIRVALGAQARDVVRMVVRQAVGLTFAGIAIGVLAALVVGRWAESLLFRTDARDPATFGLVAVTLLFVSLIASALPAWRARRVDPIEALRTD